MIYVKLREEFIKIGQALKVAGMVQSGVEAKYRIQDGLIKVNGTVELQRGKKLYEGDVIEVDKEKITIVK